MRYAPPGLCLNDFALLAGPTDWRVMHLQAPPVEPFDATALETSYGLATSEDLLNWQPGPPVFGIGRPGAFDDAAIWTMSHVAVPDGLAMFYTGVSSEPGRCQSIGLAHSDRRDGTGWRRAGSHPVVRADPRWYRVDEHLAWRDPFIVPGEDGRGWIMVLCARAADLPPDRAGCVGWATSDDLEHWQVRPPLLVPGDIDELECPVLERVPSGWLLLGSIGPEHAIRAWRAASLTGPWESLGRIAPAGAYAPRLTDAPGGRVLLHTERRRARLTDSGPLCRGVLAQPKLCLPDPERGLSLRWWPELDRTLGPAGDHLAHGEGVIEVPVQAPERVTVTLAGELPVEISCTQTRLRVGYRGEAPLYRENIRTPVRERLTVLRYGEFIEVYLDSAWVFSGPVYSGPTPRVTATVDGADVAAILREFIPPTQPRDDLSAVGYRR